MKFLRQCIQALYSIYALLLFVLFIISILPIVFVAVFFGPIKGGNFLYRVCALWCSAWFFLIGIRQKNIYTSPHQHTGQFIFIANHTSFLDIPPIFMSLRQPVRILAKHEMARIPVFGYIYKTLTIMVDRSSAEKRAESLLEMKRYLQHHISIFIFPEGTFNETGQPLKNFYDGAFKLAIETQTPIKPIIFPDTINRLHYRSVLSLSPGLCRVVFLPEISVNNLSLSDVPGLKQQAYEAMEQGLKKFSR